MVVGCDSVSAAAEKEAGTQAAEQECGGLGDDGEIENSAGFGEGPAMGAVDQFPDTVCISVEQAARVLISKCDAGESSCFTGEIVKIPRGAGGEEGADVKIQRSTVGEGSSSASSGQIDEVVASGSTSTGQAIDFHDRGGVGSKCQRVGEGESAGGVMASGEGGCRGVPDCCCAANRADAAEVAAVDVECPGSVRSVAVDEQGAPAYDRCVVGGVASV